MGVLSDLGDPRTILFAVYGFLVITLAYCSGSQILCDRLRSYRGEAYDYDSDTTETVSRVRGEGVLYELLSSTRKREIDSLRCKILNRILCNFSLTLQEEHMLKRGISSTKTNTEKGSNESLCSDESTNASTESEEDETTESVHTQEDIDEGFKCSSNESWGSDKSTDESTGSEEEECTESENAQKDIEEGIGCNSREPPDSDKSTDEADSKEMSEYTHICIPSSGIGIDCNSTGCNGNVQSDDKREVPIFCAICLSEYDILDEVCWSSNSKCTHVFHKECVVQWLVALGKRQSKMKRFPRTLNEKHLLDHNFECPCCRQEFIIKGSDKEEV